MYARRIRIWISTQSRARFTSAPMHSMTRVPWAYQMTATTLWSISFSIFFVLVVGLLLGQESARKTQRTPTMRCNKRDCPTLSVVLFTPDLPLPWPLTHVTTHDSATALDGMSCLFCLVDQNQGAIGPWLLFFILLFNYSSIFFHKQQHSRGTHTDKSHCKLVQEGRWGWEVGELESWGVGELESSRVGQEWSGFARPKGRLAG